MARSETANLVIWEWWYGNGEEGRAKTVPQDTQSAMNSQYDQEMSDVIASFR